MQRKSLGAISLLLIFFCLSAYGAGYQIFPSLAYENPATLNAVGKLELILGNTQPFIRMTYTGSVGPLDGSATSHASSSLPYMRLAWRINPKWVAGIDITHPALSNIRYSPSSIVSTAALDTIIYDTNYSLKTSYQITPKIALGAGFDANNVSNAQVNFIVPILLGQITNASNEWVYGWDMGAAITLNESNFLNISYYSVLNHANLTGSSSWESLLTTNFRDNLAIPATYTLNMVHLLSKKWTLSETIRYIEWHQERDLKLTNTVIGDIFVPLNYHNAWSGIVAARYQLNQKLAVKAAFQYDTNPQPTQFRPIALPTYQIFVAGAGLEYAMTKNLSAQILYAHGFSNPAINMLGVTGPQVGNIDIDVDIVDFNLTWKI